MGDRPSEAMHEADGGDEEEMTRMQVFMVREYNDAVGSQYIQAGPRVAATRDSTPSWSGLGAPVHASPAAFRKGERGKPRPRLSRRFRDLESVSVLRRFRPA